MAVEAMYSSINKTKEYVKIHSRRVASACTMSNTMYPKDSMKSSWRADRSQWTIYHELVNSIRNTLYNLLHADGSSGGGGLESLVSNLNLTSVVDSVKAGLKTVSTS